MANNGTVIATASWSSAPSTIEQIGGSGGANSLTGGTVYVAVLTNLFTEMSGVISSFIPVMLSIIAIAIPLMLLKIILRWLGKIF